ncbi:MAG TPA: LLM class flavin-dependent oxidoreductase [Solirubrobacteraceae bacterium]|nr:LLM class flavin-dependent oxidoreductase [Solirubrobacteraceae bacterium]
MKLGAMFVPAHPVERLPAFAERVDTLGYDELWLAEDCFAHGGISAATVALGRMERATVGVGLLPVGLRSPALAAMELGTLATLYPGRVRVAFGHGVESWMRQIGARPRNRISFLREVADSVARLTRGEVISRDGEVHLDGVRLDHPPSHPPEFLIGSTGSRALGVAGELGMGFLMPEGTGTAGVRWAREALGGGASVTIYCWLSIAEDETVARAALIQSVMRWRAWNLYPRLYELAELPTADELTVEHLPRVAAVGTPEQCARQLQSLHDAGADTIVLQAVGDDPLGSLERAKRAIGG